MTRRKVIFFLMGFPLGGLCAAAFVFFANQLFYAYAGFAVVVLLQFFLCSLLFVVEFRDFPVSVSGRFTGIERGSHGPD